MRRLWNESAIILTIYFGGIFYYCFGDLFASIPMLVTFLTIHLGIVRVSILTAGSIWFYGSKRSYARQVISHLPFVIKICRKTTTRMREEY